MFAKNGRYALCTCVCQCVYQWHSAQAQESRKDQGCPRPQNRGSRRPREHPLPPLCSAAPCRSCSRSRCLCGSRCSSCSCCWWGWCWSCWWCCTWGRCPGRGCCGCCWGECSGESCFEAHCYFLATHCSSLDSPARCWPTMCCPTRPAGSQSRCSQVCCRRDRTPSCSCSPPPCPSPGCAPGRRCRRDLSAVLWSDAGCSCCRSLLSAYCHGALDSAGWADGSATERSSLPSLQTGRCSRRTPPSHPRPPPFQNPAAVPWC